MGHTVRIYGAIFCYAGSRSAGSNFDQVRTSVLRALDAFPRVDDYPPLTRNMIALTADDDPAPGLYKELVLHLGLTLKNGHFGEVWDVWLDKFESFLGRVPWTSARLHLELEVPATGSQDHKLSCCWELSTGASPADRTAWRFDGAPRELGLQLGRFRDAVAEAEAGLRSSPDDPELLHRLISCCARLRRHEEALTYWERLKEVDPARAQSVPAEWLASWADRCQIEGPGDHSDF